MSKYLLIIAVWIILYAFPLFLHPLHQPDEARYTEITREMAADNQWLVLKINGMPYPEKPPLFNWIAAAGFQVFGPELWVGRMVSALAMLFLSLALFAATKKFIGNTAALVASIVALTQLAAAGMGQLFIIDPTFAFLMGLTILLSVRVILSESKKSYWLFGIAASLTLGAAVLAKGPVGIILVGGIVSLWAIITGNFKKLLLLIINPVFWFITIAIVYVYYYYAEKRLPGISNYFFIHENILRYFTKVHKRGAPFWYFIPIFLGGALPWTILMPFAAHFYYKHKSAWLKDKNWLWLAGIWAILPVAFFSLSSSKLPTYILLSFSGVGLFFGLWIYRISTGDFIDYYDQLRKKIKIFYPVVFAGLALTTFVFAIIFLAGVKLSNHMFPEPSIPVWCFAVSLMAFATALIIYFYKWQSLRNMFIITSIVIIIGTGLIIRVGNFQTGHPELINELNKLAHPEDIIVQYSVLDMAIPFTLRRNISSCLVKGDMRYATVVTRLDLEAKHLIDYYIRGEKKYASPTNWPCPENVWYNQKEFVNVFTNETPVLAFTKTKYIEWLRHIKVFPLTNDWKYSIIANEAYINKYDK